MLLGDGLRDDLPALRQKRFVVVGVVLQTAGRPVLLDPGTVQKAREVCEEVGAVVVSVAVQRPGRTTLSRDIRVHPSFRLVSIIGSFRNQSVVVKPKNRDLQMKD